MIKKYVYENSKVHKNYYIRTTDLESFINCPYNYKYKTFSMSNYDSFYIGKIIHTYIQHYIIRWGDDDNLLLKEVAKWVSWKDLSYLQQTKKILKENFNKDDYTVTTSERSFMINFELEEWNIILEWTLDLILTNWKTNIVDIKTAGSKWSEWMIWLKHQSTIYSVLYNLSQNKTSWEQDFEYRIFTKQNTVQFQRIPIKINIADWLMFVIKALKEYIKAEENKEYPAKKSLQCVWCSLKSDCPEHNEIF